MAHDLLGDEEPARAARPGVAQTWAETATGRRVVLLGRRRAGWVAESPVGAPEQIQHEDLVERFVLVSCAHEKACCPEHGTHSHPHIGCVLR